MLIDSIDRLNTSSLKVRLGSFLACNTFQLGSKPILRSFPLTILLEALFRFVVLRTKKLKRIIMTNGLNHIVDYANLVNPLHWIEAHRNNQRLYQNCMAIKNSEEFTAFIIEHFKSIQSSSSIKTDLKTVLNKLQPTEQTLHQMLKKEIAWGVTTDTENLLAFLTDILSLEQVEKAVNWKSRKIANDGSSNNALQLTSAIEWASYEKIIKKSGVSNKSWPGHSLLNSRAFSFVPNLVNVFLGAFNFLDASKNFTTIWEKYLLVEIIYRGLQIWYSCFEKVGQLLGSVLATALKIYVVSGLIVCAALGAVCAYKAWFKFPRELAGCESLDEQMDQGLIPSRVAQTEDLDQLKRDLLGEHMVLIVGKAGEGKTSLVEHFNQLKREKKLPKELNERRIFCIEGSQILAKGSYEPGNILDGIRQSIKGYEKQVILFADEIDELVGHPHAFAALKKFKNIMMIGATTYHGLDKIKALDIPDPVTKKGGDKAFFRRFKILEMKPATNQELYSILESELEQKAPYIPYTPKALHTIIRLASSYSKEEGRPGKVTELLKSAIGNCKFAYSPTYASPKLNRKLDEYQQLMGEKGWTQKNHLKNKMKTIVKRQKLEADILDLEKTESEQRETINKIKNYMQKRLEFKSKQDILSQQLVKANGKNTTSEDQKRYLLSSFYLIDAFNKVIDQHVQSISSKIDVQINVKLVKKVFNDYEPARKLLYA